MKTVEERNFDKIRHTYDLGFKYEKEYYGCAMGCRNNARWLRKKYPYKEITAFKARLRER